MPPVIYVIRIGTNVVLWTTPYGPSITQESMDSLQNVNLGAAAPTRVAWQAVTSNTTGGREENPFNRMERRRPVDYS